VTPRHWAVVLALLAAAATGAFGLRTATAGSDAARRFFRHPTAAFAVGALLFFVLVAVCAPLVAPYDPSAQLEIVRLQNRPPSWTHPLGTDLYSRDLLSRLVFGARVSLAVGALAMLVAVSLGTAVGLLAGYFRRGVDGVLMRLVDVGLAVPRIFLLLMAVALWSQLPLAILVLTIGLTGWFATSRLVRAEVLSLRELAYVDAARALGAPPARVIFRHVLPNALAPLIVSAALGIGNVMLLEASLSFLGIGVAPPTPSWGNMIADGKEQIATAPWTTLSPGLAIALVVMALNAVGDGLRDALDPRKEAT
jgi:peptide/nickel transport system permease protein